MKTPRHHWLCDALMVPTMTPLSGTMQLIVASWITVVCFFIGGIAVAMLLFRV